MYPYFTIFSTAFSSYRIFMITAILVVTIGTILIAPKYNLDRTHVFRLTVVMVFFIVLGSKILYLFIDGMEPFREYLANRGDGSAFPYKAMFGGWRFFGGFAFCLLGGWLYMKVAGLKTFDYMGIYGVFVPLGVAIGRLGCFCGGCCYGIAYSGVFAVQFTQTGLVHPLQLYESAGHFAIFLVTLALLLKKAKAIHIGAACIVLICAMRFLAEYIRPDTKWLLPWLSVNQIFAVAIALFTLTFIIMKSNKDRRSTK